MGIFVGACMVAGSLTGGFRDMLDIYILDALANKDHGVSMYILLIFSSACGWMPYLTAFNFSPLLSVCLPLHPFHGRPRWINREERRIGRHHRGPKKYVKTARSAQCASFCAGIVIFFDDYANTLVAGASMRPLTDACIVSREKLAFVVDATAAPIASIVPISSWVGFEISLIQAELDKILALNPNPEIATTGFSVFIETIKYRYYCIFMVSCDVHFGIRCRLMALTHCRSCSSNAPYLAYVYAPHDHIWSRLWPNADCGALDQSVWSQRWRARKGPCC